MAAGLNALSPSTGLEDSVTRQLVKDYHARHAVLVDSGTTALALALSDASGGSGTVALPGWGCPDLVTAAEAAGLNIRLYDLDPSTLGPDLDSLRRSLGHGDVSVVVVVHFFGFPADIYAVNEIASLHGAAVVEDAAQGARGRLNGRLLGAFGEWGILSFGRGKGINAGAGGALLLRSDRALKRWQDAGRQFGSASGVRALAATTAAWLLGRPGLYALPASIPALKLGEMLYHPPKQPSAMPRASVALLARALAGADAEARTRAHTAGTLRRNFDGHRGFLLPRPIAGAEPGWLRFPVIASATFAPDVRRGQVRPYPSPLDSIPAIRSRLREGEGSRAGARTLASRAVTWPTHARTEAIDLAIA